MIGQRLGHYRIERHLGAGGMGSVYSALDEKLRRHVALKLLTGSVVSEGDRRTRVLTEARAAAALNHPGIITIYEVGEQDEHVFIVMELVEGISLHLLAEQKAMDPPTVVRIGAQVADGLAAAHASGVIHGDIKPDNIVVLPDGRVKLLDFGIARHSAAEAGPISSTSATAEWIPPEHQVSGTLPYMAPEQLCGESIDARADLFSLGVVLYELCAGRRPFVGKTPTSIMAAIVHEATPPLILAAPHIPAELARIVGKLLEKDPSRRYQTATDLHVDLSSLQHDLEFGVTLPATVAGKRAVAVLPFQLLTPSPQNEYLTVALADAVINELSAGGELLVRPTTTVMRYARQSVDPGLAARELNVQVVITGSIQKFGERLRVHVQAWNATDGSTLLSAKHDASMAELFDLQDRISHSLVRALGGEPAVTTKPETERPTNNPLAYELFLRAAERLSRINRWDTHTAVEMLQNAVDLDPRFVDAWARLAEACIFMASAFEPGPRWIKQAEAAIRRALAIDRNNADAQSARGRVLWTPHNKFQNRPALRALTAALQLNPGCHSARLWKCLIFMHVGMLDEAKQGLLEGLASYPSDAFSLVFIGMTAFSRWNYDEAAEFYTRAITLDSGNIWANVLYPTIPIYQGNLEEAEERIRTARLVLPKEPWLTSCEALLWAKRGEKRKAEAALKRALTSDKMLLHTHHLWHTAAAAYAVLGKPAPAVRLLKKAAALGLPNYTMFRDDPHFTSLHDEPQFLKLLSGLKRELAGYQRDFGANAASKKRAR